MFVGDTEKDDSETDDSETDEAIMADFVKKDHDFSKK